jgi:hypothetical protein
MTSRHLIITADEQNTIVNALAFYKAYFTFLLDADDAEQYRMAFREDGEIAVDKLTTKVAIIK